MCRTRESARVYQGWYFDQSSCNLTATWSGFTAPVPELTSMNLGWFSLLWGTDDNLDKSHNSNTFSWEHFATWTMHEEARPGSNPEQFLTLPRPNPSRVNIQEIREIIFQNAGVPEILLLPAPDHFHCSCNSAFVWHLHRGTSLLRQGLQNTSVTLYKSFL